MRSCLFAIFAAISLLGYSQGVESDIGGLICDLEKTGRNGYQIHCFWVTGDGVTNTVFSTEACERLRQSMLNILDTILSKLNSASQKISDAQDSWTDYEDAYANLLHWIDNNPMDIQYTSLFENQLHTLAPENFQIPDKLVLAKEEVDSAAMDVYDAKSEVRSISCNGDGTCTPDSGGSGDAICPCQTELQGVVTAINNAEATVDRVQLTVTEINSKCQLIHNSVTGIYETVQFLRDRFDSPDDRMWSEINTIYQDIATNIQQAVYSSLALEEIFHEVRRMLAGDVDPKMSLTTEGVIGLNQLAIDMANYAANQYNASQITDAVVYFSNTVHYLFNVFDQTPLYLYAQNMNLTAVQDVFTNTHLTARGRYAKLVRTFSSGAGVTNWFQRMELYQQALLGWFDDLSTPEAERNQDNIVESQLKNTLLNTTNRLSGVALVGSNLYNTVSSVASRPLRVLDSVEIRAFMPSQITLLPAIEFGDHTFPAIYFDTAPIYSYCETVRDITSLVWNVLVWAMYLALAAGLARLVFLLVLYVIHFVRDL